MCDFLRKWMVIIIGTQIKNPDKSRGSFKQYYEDLPPAPAQRTVYGYHAAHLLQPGFYQVKF
jgi:hypothetical protein